MWNRCDSQLDTCLIICPLLLKTASGVPVLSEAM